MTAATLPFVMPTTPGTYTLQFHAGSTLLVASDPITVVPAVSASVSASPTTVASGGTVTATVSGGPGNVRDWVALHAAGDSSYLDWKYLNGTQVATTGATAAAIPFSMPHAAGTYNLALYSGRTLLATSENIRVSALNTTVTLSASTVAPGGTITATIANGPGNRTDWVALFPDEASTHLELELLERHAGRAGDGADGRRRGLHDAVDPRLLHAAALRGQHAAGHERAHHGGGAVSRVTVTVDRPASDVEP